MKGQLKRLGRKAPDFIKNKPKLKVGLNIYLDAFYSLTTERNSGMGIGRIPHSKIREYGQYYNFDYEQMELLFDYIVRMDVEFLSYMESKNGNSK